MNFKKYHVSKNLYNTAATDWTLGILDDNGQPTGSTSSHYTTNYTEVSPETAYFLSGTISTTGSLRIYFYSSDKSWISRTAQKTTGDFTTPQNCFYIRIQVTVTIENTSDWMLNTGSAPLPYEPYGNTWHDIPHYIHNTSADTITTLPAVLYPNGTTATVGLKGQTLQSSIPSPTSPAMPQGTGERTGNLFDISTVEKGRIDNGNVGYASAVTNLTITGNKIEFTTDAKFRGVCGGFIEIPNGAESISFYGTFRGGSGIGKKFVFYDAQKSWLNADVTFGITDNGGTVTIPSGAKFVRMSYTAQEPGTASISNFMSNSGSTALPYEPFGVKIPISSANTTTPIYLGEVETTRKVKKLVLDGTESLINVGGNAPYRLPINDIAISSSTSSIEWYCSHYQSLSTNDSWASYDYCISRTSTTAQSLQFRDVTKGDIRAFKQYLAAQYAAGTPVTVWYILASETTGIVNEPLMKIGNYADTVSNVSIPVTVGGDTISVGTTVQPSEVTVNYKGWHSVADVHEFTGNYTVGTMQTLPISELETHTISDLQGGEWS